MIELADHKGIWVTAGGSRPLGFGRTVSDPSLPTYAYIALVPNPVCSACGKQPCKLGLTIYVSRVQPRLAEQVSRLLHLMAERQIAFLHGSTRCLKAFTQKAAAKLAGLSPTVVNRWAGSLRVRTPVGLFRLSSLFAKRYPHGDFSFSELEARVRTLLMRNPKAKNRELAEGLQGYGMAVTPKAVARFRNLLGIARPGILEGIDPQAVEKLQLLVNTYEGNRLTDAALSGELELMGFQLQPEQVGYLRRAWRLEARQRIPPVWPRHKTANRAVVAPSGRK